MGPDKINIVAGLYKAFGFEQITVDNSVKTLSEAEYKHSDGSYAKRALITVEDARIRYTYDGTTPTSTVGHSISPRGVIILIGTGNIQNFKATRQDSTNGKITVTYEQ